MKTLSPAISAVILALTTFFPKGFGSDHADPMSVTNPFKPQDDPVANITDLHAFVVDKARKPVLDESRIADGDQLIISLCVRRRLLPSQVGGVGKDVPKYSFRVHLDLDPAVRIFDPAKTRDGADYRAKIEDLNRRIADATAARDTTQGAARTDMGARSQAELGKLLAARGTLLAEHQQDESTQALYGGIIANPDTITAEALLDFRLKFSPDGENSETLLETPRIEGISGAANIVSEGRKSLDGTRDVVVAKPWKDGAINIECGVFDDPFIFPRFFRSNVIGIVTSIPLSLLRRPDGTPASGSAILLWATTHTPDGKISDHVGRSLRSQLPRFGYLNQLEPSQHVAEIQRAHESPTLFENVLATFIAPLEAHRHYDNAPDVMIYDLRKPAKFPNGRWLEDDVSKTLADAGEPLLLELSYAESRQFPRATTNDKPFRADFPYLAPRWTDAETRDHALPGTTIGDFKVPDAPDNGAIALPDFVPAVWRSMWLGLAIGVVGMGALAFFAVRRWCMKALVIFAVLGGLCMLSPIKKPRFPDSDPRFMRQPQTKFFRTLSGGGLVGVLGLIALYAFGVRRGIAAASRESAVPIGEQGETIEDRQYDGSTFRGIRDAVFSEPYYGRVWGESGTGPLPVLQTTFSILAQGMFSLSKRFLLMDASARTLASRADLRWGGPARKGVRRMLHPNGVCLTGRWRISEDTPYTGFFAKGSDGITVARYSSGTGVRRGERRTLALVGKLFSTTNPDEKQCPASYITQEDLAGAFPEGIHDSLLRNAPGVSTPARGFDIGSLLLIAFTLMRADKRNNIRQLYEIAELGKPAGVPTRCPQYMQLRVISPKVGGGAETADFRDEVLAQIYDRGEAVKKRDLVFQIEVSDKGEVTGLLDKKLTGAEWQAIGTITFSEAAASYNGDFVIHFHHPKWRNDVNDPTSEPGPGGFARAINWLANKTRGVGGLFAKRG